MHVHLSVLEPDFLLCSWRKTKALSTTMKHLYELQAIRKAKPGQVSSIVMTVTSWCKDVSKNGLNLEIPLRQE